MLRKNEINVKDYYRKRLMIPKVIFRGYYYYDIYTNLDLADIFLELKSEIIFKDFKFIFFSMNLHLIDSIF